MKSIEKDESFLNYSKKVDNILLADARERLFQEYIIRPFLQSILMEYDVVPTDEKVSGKQHDYSFYCGEYGYYTKGKFKKSFETPDLCIAKDWKWLNQNKSKNDYIATVEIKTVYSKNNFWISPGYIDSDVKFENKVSDIVNFVNEHHLPENDPNYGKDIKKQIGIHLRGINRLIVTDGVRWIFLYKNHKNRCSSLPPIDLGKRECKKARTNYHTVRIEWNKPQHFDFLKYVINEFCSRKIEKIPDLEKEVKFYCSTASSCILTKIIEQ